MDPRPPRSPQAKPSPPTSFPTSSFPLPPPSRFPTQSPPYRRFDLPNSLPPYSTSLPSLPPRPILLAPPRGSAVLQSIPSYQRKPLPASVPSASLPHRLPYPPHSLSQPLRDGPPLHPPDQPYAPPPHQPSYLSKPSSPRAQAAYPDLHSLRLPSSHPDTSKALRLPGLRNDPSPPSALRSLPPPPSRLLPSSQPPLPRPADRAAGPPPQPLPAPQPALLPAHQRPPPDHLAPIRCRDSLAHPQQPIPHIPAVQDAASHPASAAPAPGAALPAASRAPHAPHAPPAPKPERHPKDRLLAHPDMDMDARVASSPPERRLPPPGLSQPYQPHAPKPEWDPKLAPVPPQSISREAPIPHAAYPAEQAWKPALPEAAPGKQNTPFAKRPGMATDAAKAERGRPATWQKDLFAGGDAHPAKVEPVGMPQQLGHAEMHAAERAQDHRPRADGPPASEGIQRQVTQPKPEVKAESVLAPLGGSRDGPDRMDVVPSQQTEPPEPPANGQVTEAKRMAQTEQDKPAQARNGNRQPLPALPAEPQDGLERRPLKVEDALAYLEKVKTQFKEQVDVYNQFLDIMKEFKAQSIDTTEVIRRVSNLFRGHMDLILGFNTFLPPGYKIKVTKDKATGVVNTGFDGPEGFSQLPTFLSGSIAAPSPIAGGRNGNAVSSPKRKDSKSKSSAKLQTSRSGQAVPGQAIDPMDKDASGGAPVAARGSAPAKTASVSRQNGANGLHADASALQQEATTQAHLLQAERSFSPGPEKAQEFDRAIEFVTTIKERFSDDPDTFNKFLNALSRFRDKQTSIREVFDVVACLFGPHKDLLLKFQEFLPAISRGSLDKPMRSRPPTTPLDRAYSGKTATGPSRRGPGGLSRNRRPRDMQFFEDLKASLGLGKSDVYIDFIKCLSLFTQKIVTKDELQSLTAGILQDYPHANALFLQYLEAICGSGDETTDEGNQASSSVSSEEAPTPLDAARHARYLKKTVSETGGEFGVEKLVSYSKLPPDFPAFPCAGRSVMERRTLNDAWVSGTSGSEDYSFKFMRKNQNEDNLFRCEDDRYELDMVIATNASTIQKLQTIVGSMSRLPQAEKKRHQLAEGALSPINFSAIQRIYGEKGAEVVEEVKLNPAQAAPFVVERLRSKNTEWIRARHEMNRAWREVGERNYHRSLDHRSVHFKHVDKKELSTKNLLADLLEPTTSLQARDAEMTKARGYPVPHGGGGANDRSLAFKAVKEAAQRVSRLEPPHLDLCFEECRIHRLAFDVVRDRIESETSSSSEAKRIVGEFQRLLSRFFRLDFTDDGCKRAERDFCRRRGEKHDGCNSAERESNMVEEEAMVMYGDDSLYLMFRMYHLLFERLMEGLKLARKQIADRTKRESMNKAGAARVGGRSHIPTLLTSPASLIMNFPSAQEKEHSFCVGPQHATADEIFEEWLEPLRQFLSTNKADVVNRYEEKCRVLLGAGSYCLLTLDKTVAKTSKQVGSALSGDAVAEYGTVWMFHALADRIKESTQNCAKLSWSCMEKQYAACAVAQIGKTRGSGANMMRFTSHYRDEQMNEFVIYAVGHTNDEVAGKSKTQTASVDLKELYKTCTDMLEENMAQAKESGDGEWRQRGDSTSLRKRSRVSDDSFVRFAGSEKQVRKRAKGMKLRRGGDVIWKATAKKRIKAVEGTCDYMENVNRKRKLWSNTADAKEVNEQCVWGRVVRRKRLAKEKEEKEIEEREKEEEKEKENASVAKASGAGIAESSGDKEAGEVAEKDKMSDS